jgi:hypothetical protein
VVIKLLGLKLERSPVAGMSQVREGLGAHDPVRVREVLDRLTTRPPQRCPRLVKLDPPVPTGQVAHRVMVPGMGADRHASIGQPLHPAASRPAVPNAPARNVRRVDRLKSLTLVLLS